MTSENEVIADNATFGLRSPTNFIKISRYLCACLDLGSVASYFFANSTKQPIASFLFFQSNN